MLLGVAGGSLQAAEINLPDCNTELNTLVGKLQADSWAPVAQPPAPFFLMYLQNMETGQQAVLVIATEPHSAGLLKEAKANKELFVAKGDYCQAEDGQDYLILLALRITDEA